jgi:uncharacterized protein with HEPN domain
LGLDVHHAQSRVPGYFKVDYELVWKTIYTDLPVLRAQVAALIAP